MRAKLYSIQVQPRGRLSTMARPRGGDWLRDEVKALREAKVDVLISLLTSDEIQELDLLEEAQNCLSQGITYLSFPIVDLTTPAFSASTLAFLEQIQGLLQQDKHISIHCRMGIGRSSLIAASVLVLQGQLPEQAFEQIAQVRGHAVPDTEEQRVWVSRLYQYIKCSGTPTLEH